MRQLEQIVHPVLGAARQKFFDQAEAAGAPVVGARRAAVVRNRRREARRCRGRRVARRSFSVSVCWRAAHGRGKARRHPGAADARAEKRKRADFVVDTSHGLDPCARAVQDILAEAAKMPQWRRLIAALSSGRNHARNRPRYRNHRPRSLRGIAWSRSAASSWSTACRPARLSPLSQSGAGHAGGSFRGARAVDRIPGGKAVLRRGRRAISSPSSATRRWSIHNAAFDLGFHQCRTRADKRPPIAARRLVDTLLLARRKNPGARTGSTISARAMRSTIHTAPSMARCSMPSCWPKSISS